MVELVQTLREERLLAIVLQEGVPRPQLLVLLHAAVEELANRRVVRQHQAVHLPKALLKPIKKLIEAHKRTQEKKLSKMG